MIPEDKNRLKAAFIKALNNSPKADLPIREGFFDKEGKPLTLRKAVESSLESGELYDAIDQAIADSKGKLTIDQVINTLKL